MTTEVSPFLHHSRVRENSDLSLLYLRKRLTPLSLDPRIRTLPVRKMRCFLTLHCHSRESGNLVFSSNIKKPYAFITGSRIRGGSSDDTFCSSLLSLHSYNLRATTLHIRGMTSKNCRMTQHTRNERSTGHTITKSRRS